MLLAESNKSWEEQGYMVFRNLFSENLTELLSNHYEFMRSHQTLKHKQWGEGDTYERGGYVVYEAFLDVFSLFISEVLGSKYLPSFSYSRAYHKNSSLLRHVDRKGCEVAISIPLSVEENNPWPLYVSLDKNADGTPIHLNIGDALIYKGHEVFHWREPYKGKEQVQLFMFCVEEDGPNDAMKYDGRECLGLDMKKLRLTGSEEERWEHSYSDMVQKFEMVLEGSLRQGMAHC